MNDSLLPPLAIGLGLGLLVGLQRQHAENRMAGIRTFALVTVLGVLAGALGREQGGWVAAAGLLSVAAYFVVANLVLPRRDDAAHRVRFWVIEQDADGIIHTIHGADR